MKRIIFHDDQFHGQMIAFRLCKLPKVCGHVNKLPAVIVQYVKTDFDTAVPVWGSR